MVMLRVSSVRLEMWRRRLGADKPKTTGCKETRRERARKGRSIKRNVETNKILVTTSAVRIGDQRFIAGLRHHYVYSWKQLQQKLLDLLGGDCFLFLQSFLKKLSKKNTKPFLPCGSRKLPPA